MNQLNKNSYSLNDCEEELADAAYLQPIKPHGSIIDRADIKKAKRLFPKQKENIPLKRVRTEENLTLLPDEDPIIKRGQKERVLYDVNKTISLDMIPKDYKFRLHSLQVLYLILLTLFI